MRKILLWIWSLKIHSKDVDTGACSYCKFTTVLWACSWENTALFLCGVKSFRIWSFLRSVNRMKTKACCMHLRITRFFLLFSKFMLFHWAYEQNPECLCFCTHVPELKPKHYSNKSRIPRQEEVHCLHSFVSIRQVNLILCRKIKSKSLYFNLFNRL